MYVNVLLWLAVYSTRAIHLVGRSQMRSHFYVRMSLCIFVKVYEYTVDDGIDV